MAAVVRVATLGALELLLAAGFAGDFVIEGAGSVRAGARMVVMLQPILDANAAAAAADDDDDDADAAANANPNPNANANANAGARDIGHINELQVVSTLDGYLAQLADAIIPALINDPADAAPLRDLNSIGKDIRRAGKELAAYGLAGPGDAGTMATTLGNQVHKMVSRAFKAGSAEDRAALLTPRLGGLLDHVHLVRHGARVSFV